MKVPRTSWLVVPTIFSLITIAVFWGGQTKSKAKDDRETASGSINEIHLRPDGSSKQATECDVNGDPEYAAWLKVQTDRKTLLRDACRRYNQTIQSDEEEIQTILQTNRMMGTLWVSERDKVIYCPIGKVSCSSWRLLFLRLSEGPDHPKQENYAVHSHKVLEEHGLKPLNRYKQSDIERMLWEYPRFVIARHPYSRLHSAFTEKFTLKNGQWNPLYPPTVGARIVKNYWQNPSEEALKTGRNISFHDFIHYLADKNMPQRYDFHWVPYHLRCSPCQIRYDYILKLETMDEDSDNILKCVFNTSLRLEKKNFMGHTDLSAYDNIPWQYMKNLWEGYGKDFELFGYKWP